MADDTWSMKLVKAEPGSTAYRGGTDLAVLAVTSSTSETFCLVHTGQGVASATKRPHRVHPSKPAAHLTDGHDAVHDGKIMAWSMVADPLLYKMDYTDRHLVIQKEGYYYVYSKVSFLDSELFYHFIHQKTKLYNGKSIILLMSRKYSKKSNYMRSNSYLGGVFHLYKGDAVYVEVSNTSNIIRHKPSENIFGAYMI
ncbi:Tumor necrosis factor ligand superfamily member 14 [Collichthys lucidus]|uniref:Tumor necrosis factor ligand superfamily member 14 n=1 Tax=Collichthys lucidus TaxID=240159 RepID=A0A4U5VVM1_COLLU|nr:Tumor necrosis factor ligand superfamily member 14 [Collichthys lucidus]